jgi:hypothetical protein
MRRIHRPDIVLCFLSARLARMRQSDTLSDPGTLIPRHYFWHLAMQARPYLVAGTSQINFQVVKYAGTIFVESSNGFQIYVAQ